MSSEASAHLWICEKKSELKTEGNIPYIKAKN
jgi:hypothetical protein